MLANHETYEINEKDPPVGVSEAFVDFVIFVVG